MSLKRKDSGHAKGEGRTRRNETQRSVTGGTSKVDRDWRWAVGCGRNSALANRVEKIGAFALVHGDITFTSNLTSLW